MVQREEYQTGEMLVFIWLYVVFGFMKDNPFLCSYLFSPLALKLTSQTSPEGAEIISVPWLVGKRGSSPSWLERASEVH